MDSSFAQSANFHCCFTEIQKVYIYIYIKLFSSLLTCPLKIFYSEKNQRSSLFGSLAKVELY